MSLHKNQFNKYFEACLNKLKTIENESDIKFYDFFVENHLNYPFFRDNLHPTMNLYEYIGNRIILKIKNRYKINYDNSNYELKKHTYEYGHYKPILNEVKQILHIQYDLDKIFLCSRQEYMDTVLDVEDNKIFIKDLDDFKNKHFLHVDT